MKTLSNENITMIENIMDAMGNEILMDNRVAWFFPYESDANIVQTILRDCEHTVGTEREIYTINHPAMDCFIIKNDTIDMNDLTMDELNTIIHARLQTPAIVGSISHNYGYPSYIHQLTVRPGMINETMNHLKKIFNDFNGLNDYKLNIEIINHGTITIKLKRCKKPNKNNITIVMHVEPMFEFEMSRMVMNINDLDYINDLFKYNILTITCECVNVAWILNRINEIFDFERDANFHMETTNNIIHITITDKN